MKGHGRPGPAIVLLPPRPRPLVIHRHRGIPKITNSNSRPDSTSSGCSPQRAHGHAAGPQHTAKPELPESPKVCGSFPSASSPPPYDWRPGHLRGPDRRQSRGFGPGVWPLPRCSGGHLLCQPCRDVGALDAQLRCCVSSPPQWLDHSRVTPTKCPIFRSPDRRNIQCGSAKCP